MTALPTNRLHSRAPAHVRHAKLIDWVAEMAALTEARDVYWCDGSQAEYDRLCEQLVEAGTFIRLDPALRPNSYLALQRPERRRARRGPHLHLQPSAKEDAGPTNNWMAPAEMRALLQTGCDGSALFRGCMRGRTMYVVPFSMGPLGSPIAHIGVELSDIAVRRGQHAHHDPHGPRGARRARRDGEFVPCVHTVGAPLEPGQKDVAWPCNADQVHRPLSRDARDLELRLGLRRQRAARQEVLRAAHRLDHGRATQGWLAEHMLILGVTIARRAASTTSRPRSRAPAARPTSRC